MLKLFIGNKNYSSWSMRPWVLMRECGIAFQEERVRFDGFGPESAFWQRMRAVSPVGKVPVLQDGACTVWDSLSMVEYLAEWAQEQAQASGSALRPGTAIWPADRVQRARARSLCAEMHSGFGALRSACMMNIEAQLPQAGALLWRDRPALREDVARLVSMWSEALKASDGPMLFGGFTAVDAYFAPVCMRINTYALPVPAHISAYVARVTALPAVQQWIEEALQEQDFLAFEEPWRLARD